MYKILAKICIIFSIPLIFAFPAFAERNLDHTATTPVYKVAGQGAPGIETGKTVTLQGVVTGSFLQDCGLDGFFIQGEELAPDDLPAGLFIYTPDLDRQAKKTIRKGQILRIKGKSGEFKGRPQLEQVRAISIQGNKKVKPVQVQMPLERGNRWEGVKVSFDQELTVTDNYELKKYGSLELAAGGRAFQPANFPSGKGKRCSGRKDKTIVLDDGCYSRDPDPIPYLNSRETLRVGTTVKKGLTGILTQAFSAWRIHPTEKPRFKKSNPRPGPLAKPKQGCLRVAVTNMHSYFLTLGDRGAKNKQELKIQQDKLLAAVTNIHPDILVLLEMQNRDKVSKNFLAHLQKTTQNPWRLVQSRNSQENKLRISLAYRKDRVKQPGRGKKDFSQAHDRPPLIARFKPRGKEGKAFAIAAVHFKSKGNCPQDGDVDSGQGCWNKRRKDQARHLLEFIRKWRKENSKLPVLLAGDLNAYAAEEPVRILKDSGKKDLLAKHIPRRQRYTYIYSGKSGYLDYFLASPKLAKKTCRVFAYHINADEPHFLGYKGDYADSSPYRSSDHDPIVVDLEFK